MVTLRLILELNITLAVNLKRLDLRNLLIIINGANCALVLVAKHLADSNNVFTFLASYNFYRILAIIICWALFLKSDWLVNLLFSLK